MINSNFYTKRRLVSELLGGKVAHYPIKDPSVTIEWYDYIVKANEDLYIIAERVFGRGLSYMWTYIADNNPPRMPDDWKLGDILKLPRVIIRDTDTNKVMYGTN